MKTIFEPIVWNHLKLKNRLVRSATWEGIAKPDGSITDEALSIYEELAKGGVGAIINGFTSVADNDRYFGGMMRLSRDELIPQYKKLEEIVHKEDCPILAQLALGAFYRNGIQVEPDHMTPQEIHTVVGWFVQAARRAGEAGFDGVQIHAAHFFFLSRFISPAVNHRKDAYGGSVENRARILLEILNGIRETAPSLHVTVKINSSDFTFGGLEETGSLAICKLLSQAGIDSMEVSGNGTSVAGIRPGVNEGYFVPFAARLAQEVETPVIVVGGFRSVETIREVLDSTNIQAVSLSRPLLREPDLPSRWASGDTAPSKCVSCNACYSSPSHRCVFRK